MYDPCTGLEFRAERLGALTRAMWREHGTRAEWRVCDVAFWLAMSELWATARAHVASGGTVANMPSPPPLFSARVMRAAIEALSFASLIGGADE